MKWVKKINSGDQIPLFPSHGSQDWDCVLQNYGVNWSSDSHVKFHKHAERKFYGNDNNEKR